LASRENHQAFALESKMFCNFSAFSTFQFFILNQFLRLTISFLNLFAVRPKQVLSSAYIGYIAKVALSVRRKMRRPQLPCSACIIFSQCIKTKIFADSNILANNFQKTNSLFL